MCKEKKIYEIVERVFNECEVRNIDINTFIESASTTLHIINKAFNDTEIEPLDIFNNSDFKSSLNNMNESNIDMVADLGDFKLNDIEHYNEDVWDDDSIKALEEFRQSLVEDACYRENCPNRLRPME